MRGRAYKRSTIMHDDDATVALKPIFLGTLCALTEELNKFLTLCCQSYKRPKTFHYYSTVALQPIFLGTLYDRTSFLRLST